MKKEPIDPEILAEVRTCASHVRNGDLLFYPSDSLWGIGCDAGQPTAVKNITALKQRSEDKSFITLVSSDRMLQQIVADVPPLTWDLIDAAESPLTIIYPEVTKQFSHLASSNGKVAVRMVKSGFAYHLLHSCNRPLISTSGNLSGQPPVTNPSELDPILADKIQHKVPAHFFDGTGLPSKIILLEFDGTIKLIR